MRRKRSGTKWSTLPLEEIAFTNSQTAEECRRQRLRKEKCKFCTKKAEEEMTARIARARERTGSSRTELEAEMAHTEQRRTRED